ncbi:TonB-dependent receptor plug domain-containing protein [Mariniflexile sp. AS56]|uniref:TonB-dependent receptor plug domain-containing protein n=1 Tax=Mariniflexile sp. AS56 TaxID=3063957 RepID=UPI0026EC85A9|nr:TonB-dependent receptor plug domain-containing protein [Mariniflexile sp. AS56]MDO7171846.1 TonB-dependent receptor plug domain-containing protein [Mariniflexile sp. AS56]
MSRKGLLSIFLSLFFLNVASLSAQTIQEEKQPLISILKVLEAQYHIRFSYIDDTISDKKTLLPDSNLGLEAVLEFLKTETLLEFELLDNRFVVIKKKPQAKPSHFRMQHLEEITINNYLTTGITKLNDGSITIKPETFGILPGLIEPDVLQTIQALPGVLSTDETVSNINVRGGTHDQNLLLWDGIKMYQSGHFFGLISAFNPYTTKRVHVYKNGTSAKYGDGISSIIDMQLPDNIDNEFKAGLGFNLINADAFAKIPLSKKTELQLASRRSVTDLVLTPTYDQYFKRIFQDSDLTNANRNSISQNEQFYFYDVTLKFLYDITEKDKIRLHFLNVNNRLNYDEQSTINDRNEVLNSKLTQQNLATGITYTRNWTKSLSTSSQIAVSNYDLDATNYDITNNLRLIQENEVYDGSAKVDLKYNPNHQLKINGGYQFTEVGISNLEDVNNPVFRSYIKEVIRSHAAYAETGLLSNNAKTNLKFGARLNYIQKFDMLFAEPRLSFSQRFFNNFRVELLGEYKSQTSSQIIDLQNDFLGIEKRRWVLSNNKNIPVLKSKQASVGIHYNKNKLLISAETYIKKVNGITSRSQGFQNQHQFKKAVGSYEIKGIDVLLNKQFDDIVSTWVSYSYNTNNYKFNTLNNGKAFPNNADIRHAVTFGGTYTYNHFKFALGLNWHSGKPNTAPSTNDTPNDDEITYQDPNSSNLKDYLRGDCSATYHFNISNTYKATVGASVWNITNKKNILNRYYNLDDEKKVAKVENHSLGITPNISFRLHF